MHIYLSKISGRIEATLSNKNDAAFFKAFPGFLLDKEEGTFYAPAKQAVVYNLLKRIEKYCATHPKFEVTMSKDVADLNKASVKLNPLPESFQYFTSPLRHQDLGLRFLYTNHGGGLLADPGLGKTKVILDFISLMQFQKALIVCPRALLFVWEEERIKHRPDLRMYSPTSLSWDVSIARRREVLNNPDPRALLLNRAVAALEKLRDEEEEEGLQLDSSRLEGRIEKLQDPEYLDGVLKQMQADIRVLERTRARDLEGIAGANVIVANYNMAVNGIDFLLQYGPDFMAVDEALIKDPFSTRTKSLTRISSTGIPIVLASGTLINNSPMDAYSPIRMMEPALVGESYPKFKERYCVLTPPKKDLRDKRRIVLDYRDTDEVKSILRSSSIVLRKEEWLSLPEKDFKPVKVPVSEYVRDKYMELAQNMVTEIDGRLIQVDSALTLHCKLMQFSSGFVYLGEDDSLFDIIMVHQDAPRRKQKKGGPKDVFFFQEQAKCAALKTLLEGELSSRKILLWYNMTAELELIEGVLKELGITYLVIRGGEKDTKGKVGSFNNDAGIQVLVCQAKSVNYGITVLGKNPEVLEKDGIEVLPDIDTRVYTHLFYSLNYSLEMFIQQQDRSHRIGLEVSPEYYLLVADLPIDIMVSESLRRKRELREDFLEDSLKALRRGS